MNFTRTGRTGRLTLLLLSICLMLSFTGCGKGTSDAGTEGKKSGDGKISVVTTIFPLRDWITEILGDNPAGVEITLLMDNGADLHSYQPTAEDIMKISTCDLFVYVGGESDKWVSDALKEATNKDMVVINLMDVLGDTAKEEETVEGMQDDDHEDADDHDDDEHEDADDHDDDKHEDADDHDDKHDHEDGEKEYDEHIWLSLRNADKCVGVIAEKLGGLDQENKAVYDKNAKAYQEKLEKLDQEYKKAVDGAKTKTLLFADRFPFRYMVDDYGLSYFAAFKGCSAETEASFETVTFLSGKIDELGLKSVFIIESGDGKMAKTIIENTKTKDQKVLTMNSMQGITEKDIEDGKKYLGIMEQNLEILKEALQ